MAKGKGRKTAGHTPFKSKAQLRLFFANPRLRRYAKAKAHATGLRHELGKVSAARYRALPERKGTTAKRVPVRGKAGRRRAR